MNMEISNGSDPINKKKSTMIVSRIMSLQVVELTAVCHFELLD
jgi:hypothetical protein